MSVRPTLELCSAVGFTVRGSDEISKSLKSNLFSSVKREVLESSRVCREAALCPLYLTHLEMASCGGNKMETASDSVMFVIHASSIPGSCR